jgi:hypothetical protein
MSNDGVTTVSDPPRPVKYRVVGVREDGRHVPLCAYLSLEIAERIANLAHADATFTQVIIESNEECVRRARI